jgi:hypothetical protein
MLYLTLLILDIYILFHLKELTPGKIIMTMGATESKKKREPGPYMLFCKKMRPQVVTENPKLSFGEVGRKLGEMWRELSDEEKKKYK